VSKVQNAYVPVLLIGIALVLTLLQAAFLPTHPSDGQLQRVTMTLVKVIIYVPVLFLGMSLCSFFGYPFIPMHWSLLQLLAVVLISGSMRSIAGYIIGDFAGNIVGLVIFLGLIGYFFNDEPLNALIAIFLIFAAYFMVILVLTRLSHHT